MKNQKRKLKNAKAKRYSKYKKHYFYKKEYPKNYLQKLKKVDCLFNFDTISLDDPKNQNSLDIEVYQIYLRDNFKKSGDVDDE